MASQALHQFLQIVKTRPLYARVAKHNMASLRVLKKSGLTLAGEATVPSPLPGEDVEEWILTLQAGPDPPERRKDFPET